MISAKEKRIDSRRHIKERISKTELYNDIKSAIDSTKGFRVRIDDVDMSRAWNDEVIEYVRGLGYDVDMSQTYRDNYYIIISW